MLIEWIWAFGQLAMLGPDGKRKEIALPLRLALIGDPPDETLERAA